MQRIFPQASCSGKQGDAQLHLTQRKFSRPSKHSSGGPGYRNSSEQLARIIAQVKSTKLQEKERRRKSLEERLEEDFQQHKGKFAEEDVGGFSMEKFVRDGSLRSNQAKKRELVDALISEREKKFEEGRQQQAMQEQKYRKKMRPNLNTLGFFSVKGFKEIGLSAEMMNALYRIGIKQPSHIQVDAFLALSADSKFVCIAEQSGSGKTLAYLIPLVQQLKGQERAAGQFQEQGYCQVLVLAPTKELASQVGRVCKLLSRCAPFKTVVLTGGYDITQQKKMMSKGCDVLVTTPGRIKTLTESGIVKLDKCKAVVLDECDVLLGETFSFKDQILPIREQVAEEARFVFVTATMAEHFYMRLESTFNGVEPVMGPHLHKPSARTKEELIDCSGGDDKNADTAFIRKVQGLGAILDHHNKPRVIIFCNKIENCRKVENFLKRRDKKEESYQVLAFHQGISQAVRQKNLARFLLEPQEGERNQILVCTDRTSRGLDSKHVEHVVLFDFPRDPSEYIRRIGRTARGAQGQGIVSILVVGAEVRVAKELMARSRRKQAVHRVPEQLEIAHRSAGHCSWNSTMMSSDKYQAKQAERPRETKDDRLQRIDDEWQSQFEPITIKTRD